MTTYATLKGKSFMIVNEEIYKFSSNFSSFSKKTQQKNYNEWRQAGILNSKCEWGKDFLLFLNERQK